MVLQKYTIYVILDLNLLYFYNFYKFNILYILKYKYEIFKFQNPKRTFIIDLIIFRH